MAQDASWFRRVGPAAGYQAALGVAITLLKSGSAALVVSRFRPEALPYLYVGAAALTAAVTALAAVHARRGRKDPLLLAGIGAGVSIAIALGLWSGVSAGALLLYLFAESFTSFTMIVFWGAMSDAFDARESRRAFTLLGGFNMVGGIVGGLTAQLLAPRLGTISLIAFAAVLLVAAAFAFNFHRAEAGRAPAVPPRHGARADVWRFLQSRPYPLFLGALILSFSVITPLADFVFRERAARSLGEDDLAALFGNLNLWMGLLCVAFQFLVAERLLAKLGVIRYVAAVPLLLAPFAVASIVSTEIWPAYLLKLFEAAVTLSILPVGIQLLYSPVPDELRDRVRALMDGLVKKGGLALGGLLLIGAGPFIAGPAPAWALLGALVVVGAVLYRLRPEYVGALKEQVGDGQDELPVDAQNVGPLAAELRSDDPEHVLRVLTLIEEGGGELRPHVDQLLSHSSERVVARGIQLAAKYGAKELSPALEALVHTGGRRPRTEAAWALSVVAPDRAAAVLPAFLGDDDPGLRCAAIGGLWRLTGSGVDTRDHLGTLARRGEAAPLPERREVARLLGRVSDAEWAEALTVYLRDADPSVRSIAIKAVGEGKYAALAPKLLPFLSWRDERRNTRDALANMGDAIVPMLEHALNDRSRPSAMRYELPRVLRQIGTQEAFDALLFSNVRDDAFLHYRIGVAIARLKEEVPELTADAERVREAIGRRRDVYDRLVGPFRDLQAALGPQSLLTRAVGDRLDQAYELSFWLLGLLYPARTLRRVHEHLVGPDVRRRAYALELLENVVEEEDRELVMEQTQAHHRELPPGAPGRLADHLGSLCHSDDHVLRACAREISRRLGLWTLPPMEDDMGDAMVKRMFALESVEIFAQSDVDDLAVVAQVAREHRFRAGEQIYDEGDPGDALYVIIDGIVDAYRHGERVLTLKSKEAFGDVSLLDGAPRPTKMIAREETHVLVIDRRDFLDLISDRPEILRGIFRTVARQLREVVDLAVTARRATGEHELTLGAAAKK